MKSGIELASSTWGEEEVAALHDVINSGSFTMGERVFKYEREFSDYFGSKYCLMTSSGSAANLLMVSGLVYHPDPKMRIKPGDEIIVPAVSWSTTYFPLLQHNLRLKFVDVDIETLNFDLEALKGAISEKTRAIFAVNLLGNPNDFDLMNELISTRDIILLEDNCESMGASVGGRRCGTFGIAGSFSSFFSHHISTMEGGCVLTDDEGLHEAMLALRAHGWTRNLPSPNLIDQEEYSDPFFNSFRFVLPGYNLRPLELSGAVGTEQLKKLDSFIETRRSNYHHFQGLMDGAQGYKLQKEIGISSVFGLSIILVDKLTGTRDELLHILRQENIETRPIVTGNFLKQPVIRYFDYSVYKNLPNADYIHDHGFFIGNHHRDLRESLSVLTEILQEFENKY